MAIIFTTIIFLVVILMFLFSVFRVSSICARKEEELENGNNRNMEDK